MALATGTKLGSYQVVAQIGAGGMGEVYKARDTRLDRIVAIKVLPDHLAERAATHLCDFARHLRRLWDGYVGVAFDFGSAKDGSLIFKKNGSNIMEFYLRSSRSDGFIRFRPTNDAGEDNFVKGLGKKLGGRYRDRLLSLFPRGIAMGYPSVNFKVDGAANVLDLLEEALKASHSEKPRT